MARALDLNGWTPVRLRLDGEPSLEWVYTGARRFTDPFFDHTIEAALRDPFSLLFRRRTPLAALGDWSESTPGVRPTGFVFHMTRCGSTLVAQMLARLPRFLVLSEASPVDSALRSGRVELVRLLVSALGRPPAAERMLVLKLDSWSIFNLDLVQETFPGVPWIFLYRNPLEVLASQMRNAGAVGVPGVLPPEFFGLERLELATMAREEYLARVLARMCEAALAHAGSPNGRFVEYTRLPDYVLDELPRHFGFELDEDERQRMSEVAELDAKNPVLPFEPDSEAKRAAATPAAREASHRLLRPLYEKLKEC